jgi:hypothetical protein
MNTVSKYAIKPLFTTMYLSSKHGNLDRSGQYMDMPRISYLKSLQFFSESRTEISGFDGGGLRVGGAAAPVPRQRAGASAAKKAGEAGAAGTFVAAAASAGAAGHDRGDRRRSHI